LLILVFTSELFNESHVLHERENEYSLRVTCEDTLMEVRVKFKIIT